MTGPRKLRKRLTRDLDISIDIYPATSGEFRMVRILNRDRVVASMRRSVFEQAIKAFHEAK